MTFHRLVVELVIRTKLEASHDDSVLLACARRSQNINFRKPFHENCTPEKGKSFAFLGAPRVRIFNFLADFADPRGPLPIESLMERDFHCT
jgi:hypothetical protein